MNPREIRRLIERLARIPDREERMRILATLSERDMLRFDACFEAWARPSQRPPKGEGWRTWLMMAGRGFGKTRAGAEWITALATRKEQPVRIALVGATPAEVRAVMVEGESGLLAVAANHYIRPLWEPSLGRLRFPGGSEAAVYSGADPDSLRGPAHHFAWCDELAKWAKPEESWTNLQMTLRCGERPRALVTTTPRPIPLLKRIAAERWTVRTGGATAENEHLPPEFVAAMAETYGGTRLGRQELQGELVDDVEGALWTRELIERCRIKSILPGRGRWQSEALTEGDRGIARAEGPLHQPAAGYAQVRIAPGNPQPVRGTGDLSIPRPGEDLRRIVIGVDPPASAGGDACGIVACGVGADGLGYVLGDHSVRGMSPEGWARAVAQAAEYHEADRVVAEANQGGAMVESVLRAADCGLPVRLVHASRGKTARAEPVALLFENGKAKFAGAFPELEDELAGLVIGGGYEGPGRSPDRADAMVWAMTELMLGKKRAEPRITFF